VTFGVQSGADFHATGLRTSVGPEGFLTQFTLFCPLGTAPVKLHVGGRHNIPNALAAAAAAAAAGATLEHIVAGLGTVRPVSGRLQLKKALSGAWIIDDSYNSNPSSMRAAIQVLAEIEGRKWLVLGDMAELGDFAEASHKEAGALARERGIERLYATGKLAALSVETFGPGAQWYPDTEALANSLQAALGADATSVRLLIKGSRSTRLERVVDALVGSSNTTGVH
jgi:UDP-N-acetylmuramoyl-tripeptide--D-alanyl-D-alanine ligase